MQKVPKYFCSENTHCWVIIIDEISSENIHYGCPISVSHTTDDLIFRWNATDPLVVNSKIELPQLDISHNYTADCTIEYSTGNFIYLTKVNIYQEFFMTDLVSPLSTRYIQTAFTFCRQFYMPCSDVQSKTAFGIPLVSHVHSISSYSCHVMDLILDKTRSYSSPSYTRCHFTSDIRWVNIFFQAKILPCSLWRQLYST